MNRADYPKEFNIAQVYMVEEIMKIFIHIRRRRMRNEDKD